MSIAIDPTWLAERADAEANGIVSVGGLVHRLSESEGKRKERTLPVLANHGLIAKGTAIEIVPDAVTDESRTHQTDLFRARIENPVGLRDSIRWDHDGQTYSLSALTDLLWDQYGLARVGDKYFKHWRVVGRSESLWHEAERFPR